MKRTITLLMFVLFAASICVAQSTTTRPTSEQSLQELVTEVRQLRAALQRMNAAVYKGQVTIERYKLQQESVGRVSRELNDTREQLSEIRIETIKLKDRLGRANADVEAGVKNPRELDALKVDIAGLGAREQRLAMRESQLTGELETERLKLTELEGKLNALELEMSAK